MSSVIKFEALELWQEARELNVYLLQVIEEGKLKDASILRKQLDRSAGEIMDRIAEGFEREGENYFLRYLHKSRTECAVFRSRLYRALDRSLLSDDEFHHLDEACLNLHHNIKEMIQKVRLAGFKGKRLKRKRF